MSARGSSDPDGNALSFSWFYYHEAGTLALATGRSGQPLEISGADQQQASLLVPTFISGPGWIHVILAVTDNGTPRLTRYRRVRIEVLPR